MSKRHLFLWFLVLTIMLSGCGGSDSIEALRAAGQEAYERRDYAEAREYYLQALTLDNKNRDLLVECALAYRQDYLFDSALYYLKRADLMHPNDREINEHIREVAVALGDWPNALDAIEAMARMGDGQDMYAAELADLWLKNGQPGRSYYWGRRALLAGSDNPALYLQTSTMAANYDSVEVAVEILDSAIARFGPLDQFLVNKAMLLSFFGQNVKAEQILRPIVERDDPPVPSLQLNLANILAAQPNRAKKEEALRLYEEIRDILAPNYPIDSLIKAVRNDLE